VRYMLSLTWRSPSTENDFTCTSDKQFASPFIFAIGLVQLCRGWHCSLTRSVAHMRRSFTSRWPIRISRNTGNDNVINQASCRRTSIRLSAMGGACMTTSTPEQNSFAIWWRPVCCQWLSNPSCPSVCNVEVSWSYRLEFLENNFTAH